jgi:predicted TIM-barrel fold metal-dependent hydrolase
MIHVADPVAFFLPMDGHNERLEELRFDPANSYAHLGMAHFRRLMDALEALVAAHPSTTFIGAHAGCYAENLGWVSTMLDTHPNFHIDLAGRVGELGRQPRAARALILRHPDRVLWGSDTFPPTAADFGINFRFLETSDEHFAYSTNAIPPQGRWAVSGLDLPDDVLRLVYRENAQRLLSGRAS